MPEHKWYARPVLFVDDLPAALDFYTSVLGFTKKWPQDEAGFTVCQVDRTECEIILCQDERPDRARLFIELTPDGMEELRSEIEARSIPAEKAWWGYDSIRIADPAGNELLFPLDEETNAQPR